MSSRNNLFSKNICFRWVSKFYHASFLTRLEKFHTKKHLYHWRKLKSFYQAMSPNYFIRPFVNMQVLSMVWRAKWWKTRKWYHLPIEHCHEWTILVLKRSLNAWRKLKTYQRIKESIRELNRPMIKCQENFFPKFNAVSLLRTINISDKWSCHLDLSYFIFWTFY